MLVEKSDTRQNYTGVYNTVEPLSFEFQGNECFVWIKEGLHKGVFEIKWSNSIKFEL